MKPRLCDGERERRRQYMASASVIDPDERMLDIAPARSMRCQSAIWLIASLLAWALFLAVVLGALVEWPS
jgi:hypothetical protein